MNRTWVSFSPKSADRLAMKAFAVGLLAGTAILSGGCSGESASDSPASRGVSGNGGGGSGTNGAAGSGNQSGSAGVGGGSGGAGGDGGVTGGNGGSSGATGASGGAGTAGSSGGGGTSGGGSGGSGGSAGSSGSAGTAGMSGSGGSGGSASCPNSQTFNAKATHYQLATPLVNCSYPTNTLPQYYAALQDDDYARSGTCGACARVTGPSGSVDVQIVDQCPYKDNPQWCYPGSHHVDLNQAAFSRIGNLVDGVIDISWRYIPCPAAGNLQVTFKEGSNKYWSAVMVRNHPLPITKVEYRSASSSAYKAVLRQDYNYWLDAAGFGNGPYSLRVTDSRGSVVEIDNLEGLPEQAIGSARVIETSVQFPRCQ